MTTAYIIKVLDAHYINWTRNTAGDVVAIEEWTDKDGNNGYDAINVSKMTKKELFSWLGY